jgi:hypothetical protein
VWSDELAKVFRDSKVSIIRAVVDGVKMFDRLRRTCLCSDWSQTGLGFALMQKYCKCVQITPLCCKEGWKITFAGSRFTTPAES